jgi:AraC family transcriptional regulator
LTRPNERLLDEPAFNAMTASFFERYTPHDGMVSPKALELRRAFKSIDLIEDDWLEEKLGDLLAAMVQTQVGTRQRTDALPAVCASTREELWRRVNRARDFLHSNLGSPITLSEVAVVACLSPFHLLRTFQSAFRETPHQYLQRCRLERARFLLEKTRIPVTAICLDCGFASLGSFSALFRKNCGTSPRDWRARRGIVAEENSKIREVYLTGPG